MSEITEAALVAALRAAVEKAGSPSAFARKAGVAPSYVLDVQKGHRPCGPKILSALGLQRIVTIEPVDGGARGGR